MVHNFSYKQIQETHAAKYTLLHFSSLHYISGWDSGVEILTATVLGSNPLAGAFLSGFFSQLKDIRCLH